MLWYIWLYLCREVDLNLDYRCSAFALSGDSLDKSFGWTHRYLTLLCRLCNRISKRSRNSTFRTFRNISMSPPCFCTPRLHTHSKGSSSIFASIVPPMHCNCIIILFHQHSTSHSTLNNLSLSLSLFYLSSYSIYYYLFSILFLSFYLYTFIYIF